jgi:tRNA(His) 5'-end guanylyltransferase
MESKMEVKNDSLGDRVKGFEMAQAGLCLDENQPICVRIDGKSFHTYTKGLARPYDERLSNAMIETMNFLVEKTNAKLGYTQSDEISLVFFKTDDKQQSFFGGRIQKLTSVLASMATAKFNQEILANIPEKSKEFAFFDCRIWNVPTLKDAAEVFVWRQEDAIKNAVSMAAHAQFSHKLLQGKNSREKIEMLAEKGIEWNAYPEFFKSGTYAQRKLVVCPMPKELKDLPGNEGKDSFIRSEVFNFNQTRLSKVNESPIEDFLFKDSLDTKEVRKQKVGMSR